MDKMGYEKGLVRYTTEHAMAGIHTDIVRPRTIMYTILLAALAIGLIYAIGQRIPLELDILRDRNSLYRETSEGLVENVYILKVVNMDEQAHRYSLEVSGLEGLELIMSNPVIKASGGEVLSVPVSLRVDPIVLERTANEIEFTISADDNAELRRTETARFLGPAMAR
jgi:polyferredoxin